MGLPSKDAESDLHKARRSPRSSKFDESIAASRYISVFYFRKLPVAWFLLPVYHVLVREKGGVPKGHTSCGYMISAATNFAPPAPPSRVLYPAALFQHDSRDNNNSSLARNSFVCSYTTQCSILSATPE